MPGLVKIGRTTRDPEERVNELSQATGVPTPFILIYSLFVHNCTHAENYVHTYLSNRECRVAENREFFKVTPTEAINSFLTYQKTFGDNISSFSAVISNQSKTTINKAPWSEIEKLAIDYFYGRDVFRDYKESLNLFKKATKLGSILSYRYIGEMYKEGQGCKSNLEKALSYFNDGAKKGDLECYGHMMLIYSKLGQYDNFLKCWTMYTNGNSTINPNWCAVYLEELYYHNLPLKNFETLVSCKTEILKKIDPPTARYANYLFNIPHGDILMTPTEYQKKREDEYHNVLVTGNKNIDDCSFFTQEEILEAIKERQKISYSVHQKVATWLEKNNFQIDNGLPLHIIRDCPK